MNQYQTGKAHLVAKQTHMFHQQLEDDEKIKDEQDEKFNEALGRQKSSCLHGRVRRVRKELIHLKHAVYMITNFTGFITWK